MSFVKDSILFLLGAGASVDSGIMHAKAMTDDIEKKIVGDREFQDFCDLYNYLKSSIIYQRGLIGRFGDQSATIEELLGVLSEINQKHNNILYPFIGGWNIHLLKVAGEEFEKIEKLDKKIREQLFEWINISNYDNAMYFSGFEDLATDLGSAIRVFTLNYDICVEKALATTKLNLELGFSSDREWEASNFDTNEDADIDLYLYKLHGSIDWKRDESNGHVLTLCDSPISKPELIFGTAAKLSSIDPYLFYVHEFRKYSLSQALRYIVVVGYSFSDGYINSLIGQALNRNNYLKVLVVTPLFVEADKVDGEKNVRVEQIAKELGVDTDKIVIEPLKAREFFESKMNLSYFSSLGEPGDDVPF